MKSWWIIIVALFLAGWAHAAEGLQPYLLLEETQGNSRVNLTELKEGLEKEGFVVLGGYEPAEDSRRKVLSFTHPKLLKVVLDFVRPPVISVYGGWLLPRLKQEQKFRCKILSIGAMPICRMNIQLPNRRSRNLFRGFWLPLVLVLQTKLLVPPRNSAGKICVNTITCSACLILRIRWNWGNSNPITRRWKPSKRTSGIEKTASRFSVKP